MGLFESQAGRGRPSGRARLATPRPAQQGPCFPLEDVLHARVCRRAVPPEFAGSLQWLLRGNYTALASDTLLAPNTDLALDVTGAHDRE